MGIKTERWILDRLNKIEENQKSHHAEVMAALGVKPVKVKAKKKGAGKKKTVKKAPVKKAPAKPATEKPAAGSEKKEGSST